MSRLLRLLMWEVSVLAALYLWKTYGKQWQAYWDLFSKDNPDVKDSFKEVKEAIEKMESAEKSKKESTSEKEAKVNSTSAASTASKEKADAVEKKEEKIKVPTTRRSVNPPKEEKAEVKPVPKSTKPATKTTKPAVKKIAEVVKADIANPNLTPAKKPAARKPRATPAKTDKKD